MEFDSTTARMKIMSNGKLFTLLLGLLSLSAAAFAVSINSCQTLSSPNTVYTLTNDVTSSSTCFTVAAPNVTLDCNGYKIIGSGAFGIDGIDSVSQDNTTITNCDISGFGYGISFSNVTNGKIISVYSHDDNYSAVGLFRCNKNIILNTIASSDNTAIDLSLSSSNQIQNTSMGGRLVGLELSGSHNNIIEHSTASGLTGIQIFQGSDNIISKSTGISRFNGSCTNPAGIEISNSSNNLITGSTGSALSGDGIFMYFASNNQVVSSAALSNSGLGIYISSGSNNHIDNSIAGTPGSFIGIWLVNTINNTISESQVNSLTVGIELDASSSNIFTKNTIRAINTSNVVTGGLDVLGSSHLNTFLQNNVTANCWVTNSQNDNFFNDSSVGNIYYFANGTPSWQVYNIIDTNGDNYADTGTSLPFSATNTPQYWYGSGQDAHPYTLSRQAIATPISILAHKR